MRAIRFVHRLLDDGALSEGAMKRVHVHMVANDDLMQELSLASKMVPAPYLLHRLHDAGYEAAGTFLANHRDDLNTRGTVDLEAMFS